jgi:hypothetical protein
VIVAVTFTELVPTVALERLKLHEEYCGKFAQVNLTCPAKPLTGAIDRL